MKNQIIEMELTQEHKNLFEQISQTTEDYSVLPLGIIVKIMREKSEKWKKAIKESSETKRPLLINIININ